MLCEEFDVCSSVRDRWFGRFFMFVANICRVKKRYYLRLRSRGLVLSWEHGQRKEAVFFSYSTNGNGHLV